MTRDDAPSAQSAAERSDAYPVVPVAPQGNWGPIAFAVVLAAGGALLFSALSANRQSVQAPRTTATLGSPESRIEAPPRLDLPQEYRTPAPAERGFFGPRDYAAARADRLPPVLLRRAPGSDTARFPPPVGFIPPAVAPPPVFVPPQNRSDGNFQQQFDDQGAPAAASPANTDDRVTASRLANPSRTVPRGTVIPAVLETALDSTRPGAARGLVQRDVHSFDGTRVLIPRGSRIYGEYEADLSTGQRRAAIQWTRLLRPDGVTIDLDSPASDTLGRAGVRGKVDSKFFQRFGGAILQSVLDIGVGVATREVSGAAGNGVILALPGSTQNLRSGDQQQIQPTLKVRQGSSVSVFVARDLDFSTVDP